MREILDFLKMNDVEFEENASMAAISTIRIGGTADIVARPYDENSLISLVDFLWSRKKKYKIIGRMSNLLAPDSRYSGVLIKTDKLNAVRVEEDTLLASVGVSVPALAHRLAREGHSGFEELSGIPGSLGGLVAGNGGAYGKEVSNILLSATVYDPRTGRKLILSKGELEFSYRDSILKHSPLVLLAATFRVQKGDSEKIMAQMLEYRRIRRDNQPYELPSLGSTFKHPKGAYASKMLDDLGLKGYRIGRAEISVKHAGFIVNIGGATSSDVRSLIEYARGEVMHAYKINLQPEIEYLE